MVEKKKTKKMAEVMYYDDEQRRLAKLVNGMSFDFFIMFVILADAVVLGMMTSPTISFYYDSVLYLLDRIFMGIFIVEMFLKIFALKRNFFKSGWNIFDLIIVCISSLPFMSMFIVLRTFRLLRLIKYGNRLPYTQRFVKVFLGLMPSFMAFLIIFSVFFYVFAVIAVNLYGDTFAGFGSLGMAMFTLLQVFTLDDWASSIARPVMVVYPEAWVFFGSLVMISFLLIVSFIVSSISQIISQKE